MLNTASKAKIALLERGLKPADLAAGVGLDLGYVYNLLSGRAATRKGRAKIESFLGISIWSEAGAKNNARRQPMQMEESKAMSEEATPRFSQEAAPASDGAPQAVDPADLNLRLEWIELCARVGLSTVVVQAPYSPELWQNSGFEKRIGNDLAEARLGHYDSAKYGNPISFFFYIFTKDLAGGLQLIKDRLAAIGLLPHVKIGYADREAKAWRVFQPALEPAAERTPAPKH